MTVRGPVIGVRELGVALATRKTGAEVGNLYLHVVSSARVFKLLKTAFNKLVQNTYPTIRT